MPDLNRWWEGLPSERFWMEITDRSDLGADLFAPQLDDAGHPYWSYNLVTESSRSGWRRCSRGTVCASASRATSKGGRGGIWLIVNLGG